jgi:hypothetical protein
LFGRIAAEHPDELQYQIALHSLVVLDLGGVTLVDRAVVDFLGRYIQEWIIREKAQGRLGMTQPPEPVT